MKKIKILTLLSIALLFSASEGFAWFSTTYWGVRALGMGGAFTAVSNDASAPIYNIAGAGLMRAVEVTGMTSKLFAGMSGVEINDNYLGAVVPISQAVGTLAAGWGHFGGVGVRSEDTFYAGYARNLNDILESDWVKIAIGVSAKYLKQSNNYHGDTLTNGAIAVDAGIIAKFSNGFSIGYSGKHLNRPDMGFFEEYHILNADVLGLAYYNEVLPLLSLPKFTIAVDYQVRGGEDILMFGAETRVIDGALALRAGSWGDQINLGLGYELKLGEEALLIDYAFGMPLDVQETIGSHFFSLGYRFGSNKEPERVKKPEEVQSEQQEAQKKADEEEKAEDFDAAAYLLGQ
ncbi:hypothetical protein [Endomicrobium proavitum]|uniref:PorV/PorQ family protein n=1 Tax=Endomicrobium proavitum TaxID=1408281 RepID=A0A0G3WH69_9BACT|nr:hypothetical protein [Endomicrobium proavitum]AKL97966.1 exported protein of unknown function [Endomicrobium proavitum]